MKLSNMVVGQQVRLKNTGDEAMYSGVVMSVFEMEDPKDYDFAVRFSDDGAEIGYPADVAGAFKLDGPKLAKRGTINSQRAAAGMPPCPDGFLKNPLFDWAGEGFTNLNDESLPIEQAAVYESLPIERAASVAVYGDRSRDYSPPEDSFTTIGEIWQAILANKADLLSREAGDGFAWDDLITPEMVAVMLAGLKLARLSNDPSHKDSRVDLIGYGICLDWIVRGKA